MEAGSMTFVGKGLVITRKPGERVMIGDDIVVEVSEDSRPGRTRLRIMAPQEVSIMREELLEDEQRDNIVELATKKAA
jgi:carbon storage regulator